MKLSGKEFDDLTVIHGIGLVRQQWLREVLEIYTYQDLVERSVNQIESRLKAEGNIVSRKSIESWQTQAKELANTAIQKAHPASDIPEGNKIEMSSLFRDDGWKPYASFVIEFQFNENVKIGDGRRTMVHYMEKDTGTMWPGIVGNQLCNWILDQIVETNDLVSEIPGLLPEEESVNDERGEEPVKVLVQDIRFFQPPTAHEPLEVLRERNLISGSAEGKIPFNVEVSLNISGATADDVIEERGRCLVRAYAYERKTGEFIHIGERELPNLKKGKYTYTITLPEITLNLGTYRFWVLAGLDKGNSIPDYVEIPTFRVN